MVKRLALLALLAGCPSNWRTKDTALEVGLIGLTAIDWHQTKTITKNCNEINPIIGDCGQRMNMHVYFVTAIILEMITARLVNHDYRTLLHGAWIGVEGATTWDNWQED